MLGVTQMKLTQFLENHQNFEFSWVIRFTVTFNKKLKSLLIS